MCLLCSVDAKDLDVLLAEITILNTRTELYLRFLRRRILVSQQWSPFSRLNLIVSMRAYNLINCLISFYYNSTFYLSSSEWMSSARVGDSKDIQPQNLSCGMYFQSSSLPDIPSSENMVRWLVLNMMWVKGKAS